MPGGKPPLLWAASTGGIGDHPLSRRSWIAGGAAGMLICMRSSALWAGEPVRTVTLDRNDPQAPSLATLLREHEGGPLHIRLSTGVWREKLTIDRPGITLQGSGPQTILDFNAAAGTSRPDGGTWGTGGSATLTIEAEGTTLSDLTIRNSFDYLGNRISRAVNGAQAVALAITRRADRTWLRDCRIEGYQDTLYVDSRARFDRCFVAGNVDFIFGGAPAWFEGCEIHTRLTPDASGQGYLTAPSTPQDQPFGLVFQHCRLTRHAGVPDGSTYLGRPWRAGNNMRLLGASAFLSCWMDGHIRREGWSAMGFTDPAGMRRDLQPQEARLFEFASSGPGAGPAQATRRAMTAQQAQAFTQGRVLSGWKP